MKILNLTNLEESDIKYEISRFPDGQQQIKILSNIRELLPGIYLSNFVDIQIKTRLNNFQDLELLICTVKSLKGVEQVGLTFKIHLYTPYFLGSRSDRKFEEGSNNYLKDVICPIINSLNFESVTDGWIESREIFKDPITDDGTKKSKKGLLQVSQDEDEIIHVKDQQSWKQEGEGLLTTVFKDSVLIKKTTLEEIRQRLK